MQAERGAPPPRGKRLSNTSPTDPRERDNPGKLGSIPHRRGPVETPHAEKVLREAAAPPEDGAATHQVVGGVTARLANDGYGPCKRGPGEGH